MKNQIAFNTRPDFEEIIKRAAADLIWHTPQLPWVRALLEREGGAERVAEQVRAIIHEGIVKILDEGVEYHASGGIRVHYDEDADTADVSVLAGRWSFTEGKWS